jgi:L-serine dehydratase
MISIFDLFSIGIGPSSSHTVAPMKSSKDFVLSLKKQNLLFQTSKIIIELYGSLAFTGKGHHTDKALFVGLEGHAPESVDPDLLEPHTRYIAKNKKLNLLNEREIEFNPRTDLIFNNQANASPTKNTIIIKAFASSSQLLLEKTYFSIGGGFVQIKGEKKTPASVKLPHEFNNTEELLNLCKKYKNTIAGITLQNELSLQSDQDIKKQILTRWQIMTQNVINGCSKQGLLPGGLHVKRRAPNLHKKLSTTSSNTNPSEVLDWVSLYAFAVSEENAAGGRIVTAPTNGSAGVIPAVLHYFQKYFHILSLNELQTFFMTAGAIGLLFKKGASISGAEVGCQGEIGVACSMAAAGLTALLNGTHKQIENAAEIGIEHHLGLTCDPIKGLVQIPCIERNTMGAIKAINAARLALRSDGSHLVSLDKAIRVMKKTGQDMSSKYKETSQAGLAINDKA